MLTAVLQFRSTPRWPRSYSTSQASPDMHERKERLQRARELVTGVREPNSHSLPSDTPSQDRRSVTGLPFSPLKQKPARNPMNETNQSRLRASSRKFEAGPSSPSPTGGADDRYPREFQDDIHLQGQQEGPSSDNKVCMSPPPQTGLLSFMW